jgi:hypothetical protein
LKTCSLPKAAQSSGEGNGGAAGYSKGRAAVRLTEEGAGTVLDYDSEVEMGGKIAQLGARLINGYARKYADEFFGRFAEIVSAGGAAAGVEGPAVKDGAQASPAAALPPAIAQGAPPGAGASPPAPPQPQQDSRLASSSRRMDSQTFVILVLAALLVFMTVMFVLKP